MSKIFPVRIPGRKEQDELFVAQIPGHPRKSVRGGPKCSGTGEEVLAVTQYTASESGIRCPVTDCEAGFTVDFVRDASSTGAVGRITLKVFLPYR